MKKALIAAAVIIAIAGTVFLIKRTGNKLDEGVMSLSGNVEATEVNTGFILAGRVEQLYADEGQGIKKGDKLALLNSAELQSLVAQSRAHLSETKTKLEELRAGARPQELEQAKANVSYAEAERDKAKKDYERFEALYKSELISAQQMDSARKAYDTSVSLLQRALETLSLVKEGPRKEDIRGAENRMQQAAAALRASEDRLRETILYSSVSGIVLKKNIEQGETVAPGTPVFTIGELEKPWVKVYVKEDRLGFVKLGQRAKVSVDSYPGKVYEGVVAYISSEAEFTPKNVQTQEERVKLVFGVKVSVKNVNNELKPGMPADVKIVLK